MDVIRTPPAQTYQWYANRAKQQPKPMPVETKPPVMRQAYSEDPAVAAALAEMNAYAGLGKNRNRI